MRFAAAGLVLALLLAAPAARAGAGAGGLAFITSQNADRVSVIDLGSATVVAEADVADAPAPVAYDPAAGRAYVMAADTGRLTVLDAAAQVLASADLGEGHFGLAVAPGGGVFVTDWFGGHLLRLDADLRVLWRVPTGRAPAGVAVSPDGSRVAVAERDEDAVALHDAATGARLARVATAGPHPFGVTFHADGRLFSADVMGDLVSVIDPVAGRLTGQVAVGSHPYGVAFAGRRGFVTNQYGSSLTVFDAATLAVLDTIPCGDYPEGIATLPDGSGVVVANWDSDTVQIFDAATLAMTAEIEVPSGPRAFGLFTGRRAGP